MAGNRMGTPATRLCQCWRWETRLKPSALRRMPIWLPLTTLQKITTFWDCWGEAIFSFSFHTGRVASELFDKIFDQSFIVSAS